MEPLEDKEREDYMTKLEGLVADWLELWEETTRDKILAMSYDRLKLQEDRIKELEEALKESTGYTTELRDSLVRQSGKSNVPDREFIINTCAGLTKSIERFESLLKQ